MQQSNQSKQTDKIELPVESESRNFFTEVVKYANNWSGVIPTVDKRSGKAIKMFMGLEMAQAWPDLMIWEAFFNQYRFKTLIELGTGHGGMALFFALQCYQRGIEYHTFDNVKSFTGEEPLEKIVDLNGKFHHVDIFNEGYSIVLDILKDCQRPVAFFFDNGDKPREWKTFGPLTQANDFLVVHDWGTEFLEADIDNLPVVRILGRLSDKRPHDWKAMWFKRV